MLRALSIRDYVIVDRLDLELGSGFTALTGETGAGKSILVDALALAIGGRADAGVVRAGAQRAEVSADFDAAESSGVRAWLAAQELDEGDGACLVRRTIDSSGRSRGFVNGRPATAAQLRELGEMLVDIHGQHDHQLLMKRDRQRALLDSFAGIRKTAAELLFFRPLSKLGFKRFAFCVTFSQKLARLLRKFQRRTHVESCGKCFEQQFPVEKMCGHAI